MKSLPINFRLTDDLAENLQVLADYYCTETEELILDALEEFFHNHAGDLEQAYAESEADEL